MNPLLEVNPGTCIVVVGPLVARSCLSFVPGSLKLTYHSLISAGLEMVKLDERGRLQDLVETDKDAACKELTASLAHQGDLERWINYCSAIVGLQPLLSSHQPPLLQLLLNLQTYGCRLVYTHYDSIMDAISGMKPILSTNSDQLEQWIDGRLNGFYHIHGHHTDLQSLILYTSAYETMLTKQALFFHLKELFRHRTLVFIGHDPDHLNPLLVKMTQVFLQDENAVRNPPLYLSSSASLPPCFLHLPISRHEENTLHELIIQGSESTFITGRTSEKLVDKDIVRSQAVLLFSEKQSFRRLGDIIYQLNQSGEIYVRRDALTILFGSKIMYGNILTYGGSGLQQIWNLVIPPGSVFRKKGLVAIGLQNSLMIWINRKPSGLGPITEVNTFHSLWNNSATAMRTQSTSSTSSITSTTSMLTPTITTQSSIQPTPTVAALPLSYHTFPSLFPVISPTFLPLSPLFAPMGGLHSPAGPAFLTPVVSLPSNLFQMYGVQSQQPTIVTETETNTSGESHSQVTQTHFQTTRPQTEVTQTPSNIGSVTSNPDPSIIDIETPTTSLNQEDSECTSENTGTIVFLRADPAIAFETLLSNELQKHEHKILKVESPMLSIVQTISRSSDSNVQAHSSVAQLAHVIAQHDESSEVSDTQSTEHVISIIDTHKQVSQVNTTSQTSSNIIQSLPKQKRPTSLLAMPFTLPMTTPTFHSPLSLTPIHQTSLIPSFTHLITSQVNMPIPHVSMTTSYTSSTTSISSRDVIVSTQAPTPRKRKHTHNDPINISHTHSFSKAQSEEGSTSKDTETKKEFDSTMHLWEFLLHLLLTPNHGHVIQWTGRGYEFCITDPTELTKLWIDSTGRDNVTFNTLLGEIRSYTGLGIMEAVEGKDFTYNYILDIQKYLNMCAHKITGLTTSA